MLFRVLADAVVLLHLGFILFVMLGGLVVLRWPRLALLHLPAVAWGVLLELCGWVCPLTPLENHLRRAAGGADYENGFVEHYLTPLIYPAGLGRSHQVVLGIVLVVINAAIYGRLLWKRRRVGA